MNSETTSLVEAKSAREEWTAYLAFLKRPALPARAAGFGQSSLAATLRLLALDLSVMGTLILLAIIAISGGFVPPSNALAELDWNMLTIIGVVVLAPVLEELFFRSWLSGRPGALVSLPLAIAGIAAFQALNGQSTLLAAGILIGAVLAAVIAAVMLRKKPAYRWFASLFPALFWLSTAAFALVHLLNYTEGSLAMLLPLVIPQFISGSIFGFARVQYGLWSSIVLHMLHNGALVLVVVTASKLGA